jgi:cyclic pyranopterin phosphate synthase
MTLSHVDADGRARMVDVGDKAVTERHAVAGGTITMSREALDLVRRNSGPKGDVLTTAELAGVMGAKRTAELIPLCHPVTIDHVRVQATVDEALPGVRVEAAVRASGRTGVEMEALTAVMVALLTVYDMVKGAGYDLRIENVELLAKSGGRHGTWTRGMK